SRGFIDNITTTFSIGGTQLFAIKHANPNLPSANIRYNVSSSSARGDATVEKSQKSCCCRTVLTYPGGRPVRRRPSKPTSLQPRFIRHHPGRRPRPKPLRLRR